MSSGLELRTFVDGFEAFIKKQSDILRLGVLEGIYDVSGETRDFQVVQSERRSDYSFHRILSENVLVSCGVEIA